MTIRDFPSLTKACELLVCDNIPAQMDRASILLYLLDTSVQDSTYKWEQAERELMDLTEEQLEQCICGEEGYTPIKLETELVLTYLFDRMNIL